MGWLERLGAAAWGGGLPRAGRAGWALAWCVGLAAWSSSAAAVDFEQARRLYYAGRYNECAAAAAEAIEQGTWSEAWRRLKIEAELASGRIPEAVATLEEALARYRYSVALRLLARRVYLASDQWEKARAMLDEIESMVRLSPWRYTDAASRVAVGRFFLLRGADPRQVLEYFFDQAHEDQPQLVEPLEAAADLALAKHDYALAAESLEQAVKLDPENPDLRAKLARAYAPSDPKRAEAELRRALAINPRHVDSLLLAADRLVDAERHEEARRLLEQALAVRPEEPRACALLAAMAHLRSDVEAASHWRTAGLCWWSANPEVDHLIGRKLSQQYRFAEGAARQRLALQMDPDYLPAKIQLAQDLLRLGREDEGWRLVEEVTQADPYDVVAHNLAALRTTLEGFVSLERDGVILRMDQRESRIYGRQALELLVRAKKELGGRYGATWDEPVTVEVFARQSDFAVRTFGLPGGEEFLGVCFGPVITAVSPAALPDRPVNWQSVLWHEFCHAVTLRKTSNRMPRWLSEGISVYEERRADPRWGQSMTPAYRRIILEGGLTPVRELSGAFLRPPTPAHLQLAYYESSLVVEYLVDRYGLESLLGILDDLAAGVPINRALARRAAPLEELERGFERFARRRAASLGPEADWTPPPPDADLDAWLGERPSNVPGLRLRGRRLLRQGRWREAAEALERLVRLHPTDAGPESGWRLLAEAYRNLGDTDRERAVLEQAAELEADALPVYLRLIALARQANDWEEVERRARQALAVHPLLRAPHAALAEAAERRGRLETAIAAYQALLELEPLDPAQTYYRLAAALRRAGDTAGAKRRVLQALEAAPRYREALRLLLELAEARRPAGGEPDAGGGPDP